MFSENKKSTQMTERKSSQSVISKNTKIIGDFNSEDDFRIDGTIEGNIVTNGKVVIGNTGFVKGKLQAEDAYLEGKFSGEIVLTGTLTLKATAHIEGEILTAKLAVEPGATFNVSNITCATKGTVKDLNVEKRNASESTEKIA